MVRGFEIGADLFEREPGGLELTARVQRSLIGVVPVIRMPVRSEGVDREGPHLWPKLNHADIRRTRDTVIALLTWRRPGVEGIDGPVTAVDAGNRKTWPGIFKLLVPAFVAAL
jgi:hypothetical protein